MTRLDAMIFHFKGALHAGDDHANRKRRPALNFEFVKVTRVPQVAVAAGPEAPVERVRQ